MKVMGVSKEKHKLRMIEEIFEAIGQGFFLSLVSDTKTPIHNAQRKIDKTNAKTHYA